MEATGSKRTRHKSYAAYSSWLEMRRRCLRPSHRCYASYGGRGITIDSRWDSFANFLEDMGERADGLTIDRKDNDGPYSKDNCRWATYSEQNRNRRSNRVIEFRGQRKLIVEWAEELGLNGSTIGARLNEFGYSAEEALTTQKHGSKRKLISFEGHARSIREWASHLGIDYSVLKQRLRAGWCTERALTATTRPYVRTAV